MATADALFLFLSSLENKNYYDILRWPRDASAAEIKAAFHSFSLLYHPDRYVDSPSEVRALASEIFKRGVEAYRCLSRPEDRQRYDRSLERGKIRMDPFSPSTRPPPPSVKTLEMVALTPQAKRLADRADRLIATGKLGDAVAPLRASCQCEPYNQELAERLAFLYEALALEEA